MSEHLTDFEILLVSTGKASHGAHQALLDHAADCDDCRERLAECAREQITAEEIDCAREADAAASPGGDDPAAIRKIVDAVSRRHRQIGPDTAGEGERVISLYEDAPEENDASYALAARPKRSAPDSLPVLRSADGRLVVRFRNVQEGDGYRAYIIGDLPGTDADIRVAFPHRDLEFPVDEKGKADLPGITIEDLPQGTIRIGLRPGGGEGERE